MSVSMMIFSVAPEGDTDDPICAYNKGPDNMQSTNIPVTKRIT
jgi:hypothetical protein